MGDHDNVRLLRIPRDRDAAVASPLPILWQGDGWTRMTLLERAVLATGPGLLAPLLAFGLSTAASLEVRTWPSPVDGWLQTMCEADGGRWVGYVGTLDAPCIANVRLMGADRTVSQADVRD
jgi:hypothetical protein